MRACVRGSERFAEHVQHPGLPFSIKILHVLVPFNSTTTHISPKCLNEQNVQLMLELFYINVKLFFSYPSGN